MSKRRRLCRPRNVTYREVYLIRRRVIGVESEGMKKVHTRVYNGHVSPEGTGEVYFINGDSENQRESDDIEGSLRNTGTVLFTTPEYCLCVIL